jgi:magnesium-protoporphyrin O-methyltransferase
MAGCCPSRDYHRFFNQRFARRLANRYRKRGLDKTAQTMVQFLHGLGLEGASVLEVGGGVGEIQIELLQAGAAHAQNLELSPAYEQQARTLAAQAGSKAASTGASTTSPRTPGRWRRPTWWSCTGWCAATPTTSACL